MAAQTGLNALDLPIRTLPLLELLLGYLLKDARQTLALLKVLGDNKERLDKETWRATECAFSSQYLTVRIILDTLTLWRAQANGPQQLAEVEDLTAAAFEMQDLADQILTLNQQIGAATAPA